MSGVTHRAVFVLTAGVKAPAVFLLFLPRKSIYRIIRSMEKHDWAGHNPNDKEQQHVGELMADVYDILEKPPEGLSYPALEEEYLKVIDKDSDAFTFYSMLANEVPSLYLEIRNEDAYGHPLDVIGASAVRVSPDKTDQALIDKIKTSPLIQFLTGESVSEKERVGHHLEEQGLLAHGSTDRFLLRTYLKEEKKYPNSYQDEIERLHGTQPMRDDEVEDLMREAIQFEQQKKMMQE